MANEIAYSALILDDKEVVIRSLERALKARGFITWATQTQTEAIQFVQSHRPSVACIDLHMPGINGIEVINQMRGIVPDIRIVVVTGYLDKYQKEIEPLKVRVVEKGARIIQDLERVVCEELELSRGQLEAIKTREKAKVKARILFVDDEDEIADFNRDIAIEEGFEAESCHSAAEALEKAKTFKPDILCSDLNMSKMEGDQLIKTLKASPDYSSIKVYVGMTGDSSAHNRFLSVGAREVLSKPFDMTMIVTAMRRWAEWANS